MAANKIKRNLTVEFDSPNARYNLLLASGLSSKSSSLQRLTDVLENDNRRRLEESLRSNKDLRVNYYIRLKLKLKLVIN